MAKSIWYCPICQAEGTDGSVEFCPTDGARVKPTPESGSEWVGKTIGGKYRITRFAYVGGADDIFCAEHLQSGKKLSIKLMRSGSSEFHDIDERVRLEASRVSEIRHHNLAELKDFGCLESGGYFVVMEALFGLPLSDALKVGQLSPRMSLKIVAQACEALAEAHQLDLFHGDINPDNLFLQDIGPEADPLLKVLELGFGKLRGFGAARNISPTGNVSGTPAYMAPEQCLGAEGDCSSDIYSLGVVLFELLLGRLPFEDLSPITLLTQHVTEDPHWDRALAEERGVPPEAELVVTRAMSKNPQERQGSVRELKRDLDVLYSRMIRGSRHSRHVANPMLTSPPASDVMQFDVVQLVEGKGLDGEIVQLAPDVYWVGRRHNVRIECNAYLRVFRGNDTEVSMLISPGPQKDFDMVRRKVESVIGSLDSLHYILLSHQGPDHASNAALIQQVSPKTHVICSEDTWRMAQFYGLDEKRCTKTERFKNNEMKLATGHKMIIVPTAFCPYAGSVMYYDPETQVLFSGDLFGGTSTGRDFVANSDSVSGVELFHEIYMPSGDALAAALEQTNMLDPKPKLVAPAHGAVVDESQIDMVLGRLKRLDLGFGHARNADVDPRYLMAANEMLVEFSKIVGKEKTVQMLHEIVEGGSFTDLFEFSDLTNITAFRVEPRLALEILFRDALKTAPVGTKSQVSTDLSVALNRVLSG